MTDWHIDGDYVLACNCDYGCPCNFNARPTAGWCEGVIGFAARSGRYGDVDLAGGRAFIAARWPGAIHEGRGVASLFVDAAGSPAQQEALCEIISGLAGPPFEIFASTFARTTGPTPVPIDVTIDGKDTAVTIGEHVRIAFEPIRNPVSKAEAFPSVVLPQGFVFQEGEQYSLREFWVDAGAELRYSHPGKCGELARVRWGTAA